METKVNKKELRSNKRKIILGIVLIALGILILAGLFRFGSVLTILLIYPWVFSKVSGISLDPYLIRIIAVPATIAIGLTLWQLVFSKDKRKIIAGVLILGLIIILHSFFILIVNQSEQPVINELVEFRGSLPTWWIAPLIGVVATVLVISAFVQAGLEEKRISINTFIGVVAIFTALFIVVMALLYGLIESSLGLIFAISVGLIAYLGLCLLFYGKCAEQT